jgi:hypothetical protein
MYYTIGPSAIPRAISQPTIMWPTSVDGRTTSASQSAKKLMQVGTCRTHGLHIVKQVPGCRRNHQVLDFPFLDLATPEGRGFLAMFSAMAERERARIVARTREGRRLAMHRGVKMGPPFKLTQHQRQLAAQRMATGESKRQIARDLAVSHNTIARLR